MHLCIDIGNSQIYCAIYDGKGHSLAQFRYANTLNTSSDQFGLFLKGILAENNICVSDIKKIGIASVVPALNNSLEAACEEYIGLEPKFLSVNGQTAIKVECDNPIELGADRLASAMGATMLFPNQDIMIVDFGTATTVSVVTSTKQHLGGAILAGIKTSAQALCNIAAQLSMVEIVEPKVQIGKSTIDNVQLGLYYGQLGAVKEIIALFKKSYMLQDNCIVLGTGGFSYLFKSTGVFHIVIQDLVLVGINQFISTH